MGVQARKHPEQERACLAPDRSLVRGGVRGRADPALAEGWAGWRVKGWHWGTSSSDHLWWVLHRDGLGRGWEVGCGVDQVLLVFLRMSR